MIVHNQIQSDELKDIIMSEVKKMVPRAEKAMLEKKFTTKFVELPILIDGVIDRIRYNVEEKRFDRIGVYIATRIIEEISHFLPMSKNAVYCDKAKVVYIVI